MKSILLLKLKIVLFTYIVLLTGVGNVLVAQSISNELNNTIPYNYSNQFNSLPFPIGNTNLTTQNNNGKELTASTQTYKEAFPLINNNTHSNTSQYRKTTSKGVYFNVNIGLGYIALPTYKYGNIKSSTPTNSEISPNLKDFTIRGLGPMIDIAFYPISNKYIFLGAIGKGSATYLPGINSSQHSAFLDLGIRGGVGNNELKVIGEYSLKQRWAEYRYSINDESSSLSTSSQYNTSVNVFMRRVAFGLRFGDKTTESTYFDVRYFLDKIYMDPANNHLYKGLDLSIHVRKKLDLGFEIGKNYIRTGSILINPPYDDQRKKTGLFLLFSVKKSLDFGR
ncbi:MAG TPA: hypothetical protein VNW06_11695 [Cytophagaceae bacterium]|nr:hypothetical protein [Cytophagaceae bacterium]